MSVADDIVTHVRRAAGHLKEASDAMTSAVSDCVTTGVDHGTRDTLEFAHQQAAHLKRELLAALQKAKGNRATPDISYQRVKGVGMSTEQSAEPTTDPDLALGQDSVVAAGDHDIGEGEWKPGDPAIEAEGLIPAEGEASSFEAARDLLDAQAVPQTDRMIEPAEASDAAVAEQTDGARDDAPGDGAVDREREQGHYE